MSRTKKGNRPPGYEYWSKRPGSNRCGSGPGKIAKRQTHRLERLEGKKQIRKDHNMDDNIDSDDIAMIREQNKTDLIPNSWVIRVKDWEPKYPSPLKAGKMYLYLGEILQAPGHGIFVDDEGRVQKMYHTDDFRMATEDET